MTDYTNRNKIREVMLDAISSFTINQKMSFINLLMVIAVCDDEVNDNPDDQSELRCINNYIDIVGVGYNNCQAYQERTGFNQIFTDLKLLPDNSKELLVIASYEVITSDGGPNITELDVANVLFEKIGVSDEEYINIIDKYSI